MGWNREGVPDGTGGGGVVLGFTERASLTGLGIVMFVVRARVFLVMTVIGIVMVS